MFFFVFAVQLCKPIDLLCLQLGRILGARCATLQVISLTCFSARAVAYIIMQPVWTLVPHQFCEQDGSVQSVKCVRPAGLSFLLILSK